MQKDIVKLINKLISDEKQSRLAYYANIDNLVWKEIEYYGMNVLVESVFKYTKWQHFYDGITIKNDMTIWLDDTTLDKSVINSMKEKFKIWNKIFPWSKAVFIIKLLDEKNITDENGWYMFMDTAALKHSIELEEELKQ